MKYSGSILGAFRVLAKAIAWVVAATAAFFAVLFLGLLEPYLLIALVLPIWLLGYFSCSKWALGAIALGYALASWFDPTRLPYFAALLLLPVAARYVMAESARRRAAVSIILVLSSVSLAVPARAAEACFPESFLWGASSSAHQVEGGLKNSWTEWEAENAQRLAGEAEAHYGDLPLWEDVKVEVQNPENYRSGDAADYWNRYAEDHAIAQSLGFTALRISIDWSRVEPEEGEFDEAALARYRAMLQDMRDRGIQPVVTLWHWPLPLWLEEKGGWEAAVAPERFALYAEKVAGTLGDLPARWITLNEPTVFMWKGFIEGGWPPAARNPVRYARTYRHLVAAHRGSYAVLKRVTPATPTGIAHNMWAITPDGLAGKAAAPLVRWWINRFFLETVEDSQDFIGLNYYFSKRVGIGTEPESKPRSDLGWDLDPSGLELLLGQVAGYGKPIVITEHGLADKNDTQRAQYIADSLDAIEAARQSGANVQGYLHWSLTDNFEWSEGFWPRFGLVGIDFATQRREVRGSALSYAKEIESRSCPAGN